MSSRIEAIGFIQEDNAENITRYRESLDSLLLTDENLRNRRILDIGSADGGFARYVRSLGLNCEIVDLDTVWAPPPDAQAVRADAYHLPFRNNVFDLVVSSGCIPILCIGSKFTGEAQARQNTKMSLSEAFRVTKPGGQVRMNSVPTIGSVNFAGHYEWEYFGLIAVADAVKDYVRLLNSRGNKAFVKTDTLIIYKKG